MQSHSLFFGLELIVESVAKPFKVEAPLREKPRPGSGRETHSERAWSGGARRLKIKKCKLNKVENPHNGPSVMIVLG